MRRIARVVAVALPKRTHGGENTGMRHTRARGCLLISYGGGGHKSARRDRSQWAANGRTDAGVADQHDLEQVVIVVLGGHGGEGWRNCTRCVSATACSLALKADGRGARWVRPAAAAATAGAAATATTTKKGSGQFDVALVFPVACPLAISSAGTCRPAAPTTSFQRSLASPRPRGRQRLTRARDASHCCESRERTKQRRSLLPCPSPCTAPHDW